MANAYEGKYTQDNEFEAGNPYDANVEPEKAAQWEFQHQSGTIGAGAPFSAKKLGLIAATMAAPYGLIPGVDYVPNAVVNGGATTAAAVTAPAALSTAAPIEAGLGAGGTLAGGGALPGAATLGSTGAAVTGGAAAAAPEISAGTIPANAGVSGGVGPTEAQLAMSPDELEAAARIGGGGGILSTIGKYAGKYGKMAGSAIGGATKAAANNRGEQNKFDEDIYRDQINNDANINRNIVERGTLEGAQRHTDARNLYLQSVLHNPSSSPYNARPQTVSPELKAAYDSLGGQASTNLANPRTYNMSTMPIPTARKPPDWRNPGTMESIGDWLGPVMTGIGSIYGDK